MRIALVLVLIFAALVRFWALDKFPPGTFGDELDVGYHAYSLLETGRDYNGNFLPTYIKSFAEYRTPLLMYVTAPSIALLGMNEWGLRAPEALFGVLGVLLLYLLVVKTTQNKTAAIISALFLAVSPWHIQYSRATFEVSLLLALLLSGSLFFLYGLKRYSLLFLSAVLFALTFYTYSTVNLFTPLLVILLIAVYSPKIKKIPFKAKLLPLLVFVLLSLPIVYHTLSGTAGDRFKGISVFNHDQIIDSINRVRADGTTGSLERIFHNKPIAWTRAIALNYAESFSPVFLFSEGDPVRRHSLGEIGPLFWIQLPLILLGLTLLLTRGRRQRKSSFFWLGWLLVAPLPASLTVGGGNHATRLILELIPLTVLTALGVVFLSSLNFKPLIKKVVLSLLVFVLFVEFILYAERYLVHYPKETWRWWQVGHKEAVLFMKEHKDEYDIIAFNQTYESSLLPFLFWWQYPATSDLWGFQIDKVEEGILPGFVGFKVGERYYFGVADEKTGGVSGFIKPNILYLMSHEHEGFGDWDWEKDPPEGIEVLKTLRNPYGEPIFYVVTRKPGA